MATTTTTHTIKGIHPAQLVYAHGPAGEHLWGCFAPGEPLPEGWTVSATCPQNLRRVLRGERARRDAAVRS